MNITLFHFPGACSRVTMNALEEIGVPFNEVMVNFRDHAQQQPEYLAINPKGKVPALAIDADVLTENAAILWTLNELNPSGDLLPAAGDPVQRHGYLADLAWCSGTLHPIVRQIRMPMKWTTGETEGVRAHGIQSLLSECQRRSDQIADAWWYGDRWSIVDTYFYWAYTTAEKGGFPLDRFPGLMSHSERLRMRPSFQRVLAREQAALDSAGIHDIVL